MIKTLIVDDERLARKELKNLLDNITGVEIIGEAANAEEALEKIDELKPDLLLLDIQMPGKTGFDLLEDLDVAPHVIFTTAYDEYAIKAFEINALDYLLKPIDEGRLNNAIQKVKEIVEKERKEESEIDSRLTTNDQVFLKDGEKCWFVKLDDVRLFESEGNYVRVYFEDSKPLILKSLNSLEKKLTDKEFFRASRKHIVNLNWIKKVEPWFNGGLLAILKSDQRVEISRRQSVKFKDKMSL